MAPAPETTKRFARLFKGRTNAFGTGRGQWVKKPLTLDHYGAHLDGVGTGLGVAPLLDDGTVWFAAIDLDEPDFAAAEAMLEFIPGPAFIERSRSGNAHIWVFFVAPIDAWCARGLLKEAVLAAGKGAVEVFPKQDKLTAGLKLGNYINLPYHGQDRPIVTIEDTLVTDGGGAKDYIFREWPIEEFLHRALLSLNDPMDWHKRARWLQIGPPDERGPGREHGTAKTLHTCAEYIIAHREENPVLEGSRNAVQFALAKMLTNYEGFDSEEALGLMKLVNDASPYPLPDGELVRILRNAERGGFTSTDCDNPLVVAYADPDCPIAHPESARA